MYQSTWLTMNDPSLQWLPGIHPVLVVIPAYNEAARIADVVSLARRHLPVLVVDDGSSDDTVQMAESAGAEVLKQEPNQGKGAALRAGFAWALVHGYEAVITLDADGQHDPREIPKFLSAYSNGANDLVIGMRSFKKMPFSRRLANTTGRWLFSWAMRHDIPDNQSGYRLISKRLMESLLDSTERGFEFEVEMIATCLKRKYQLNWVPIQTIYTGETSHIHPLKHIWNYFRIVWLARRKMRG